MKLLLILPAFNEEKNILSTVRQITAFEQTEFPDLTIDYLIINDGSTDGTAALCKKEGLSCLSLVQNLGIGGAVQTGYLYAARMDYDIAVQFDGDGQHDIRSLPDLIRPIIKGEADFTVGSRFLLKNSDFLSTPLRRFGIRFLSFILRLFSGLKLKDVTSGFRAANKKVIGALAKTYPADYPEPESLAYLQRCGFSIKEVPANMFERAGGQSSIRAWKTVYYMVKVSLAIICACMQKKERGQK